MNKARALAGAPDGGALLAKLQDMSYPETLAVVEIVERYRSRFDPSRPLAEALAALGVEVAPWTIPSLENAARVERNAVPNSQALAARSGSDEMDSG